MCGTVSSRSNTQVYVAVLTLDARLMAISNREETSPPIHSQAHSTITLPTYICSPVTKVRV